MLTFSEAVDVSSTEPNTVHEVVMAELCDKTATVSLHPHL